MRKKLMMAALGMTIGSLVAAADGPPTTGKAATNAEKACLAALKKKAAGGDGKAAKILAIHYGDEAAPQVNPALALHYLKLAIERGTDVSDVAHAPAGNILSACEADPALKAALAPPPHKAVPKAPVKAEAPAAQRALAKAPAAPSPAAAEHPDKAAPVKHAKPAPAVVPPVAVEEEGRPVAKAPAKVDKPVVAAPAVPPVLSVAEYERLAADAEWNGKMPEAVKLWERARDLGSRPAAKRLYQIFSFGAGGVEADYVKAIEAAQVAQKLGLEVPPLPRK